MHSPESLEPASTRAYEHTVSDSLYLIPNPHRVADPCNQTISAWVRTPEPSRSPFRPSKSRGRLKACTDDGPPSHIRSEFGRTNTLSSVIEPSISKLAHRRLLGTTPYWCEALRACSCGHCPGIDQRGILAHISMWAAHSHHHDIGIIVLSTELLGRLDTHRRCANHAAYSCTLLASPPRFLKPSEVVLYRGV